MISQANAGKPAALNRGIAARPARHPASWSTATRCSRRTRVGRLVQPFAGAGRRRGQRQHQGGQPARAARPLAAPRVRHGLQPRPADVRHARVHADRSGRDRRVPAGGAAPTSAGVPRRDTGRGHRPDHGDHPVPAGGSSTSEAPWPGPRRPSSLRQLWRQRYRWCYGTMQAMWKHRRAVIEGGPSGRLGRRGLAYLALPDAAAAGRARGGRVRASTACSSSTRLRWRWSGWVSPPLQALACRLRAAAGPGAPGAPVGAAAAAGGVPAAHVPGHWSSR